MAIKKIFHNRITRFAYSFLSSYKYSFNYFHQTDYDNNGKQWKAMTIQIDYNLGKFINKTQVRSCGRSVGKCEVGTEYTELENGKMVMIKNLPNEFNVQTFNEKNNTIYWTKAFKNFNKREECYKLTLEGGMSNKTNKEHPYLSIEGWKELKNLKTGEYIAQPKYISEPNVIENNPSDEEMKIIGYLLGDGCITSGSALFTNIEASIVNEVRNIAKEFDCKLKKCSKKDKTRRGNYRISKNKGINNKLIMLLKELDIWKTNSHTKFIPDKYFSTSNEKLAILINRLFACDGWFSGNKIGYCSVSEKMIKQVQYLLLRFGIRSIVNTKKVKYNGGINIAYQMNISSNYVRDFYEKIGIYTKLTDINTFDLKNKNDRKNQIPLNKKLYKELKSKQIITERESEKSNCRIRDTYNTINEEKLKRFIKLNNINENEYNYLWKNVTWIKIKKIEAIGIHDTYAIEVPETHTHILKGILSHNTSTILHEISMCGITEPGKKTGYIVAQDKHFIGLKDDIQKFFNRPEFPFLSLFYKTFKRDDRTFHFHTDHTVECRVMGQDKTGQKQFVALHVDNVIVDEAQLIPSRALRELTPTQKSGGKFIYAGVPNDDRTSALWWSVSNPDMLYFNYASHESIDWDESREKRELAIHGSINSPGYINLVLGKWGDPSTTAFRVSQIMSSFDHIPEFTSSFIQADDYKKAEKLLNLSSKNYTEYDTYGIGMDMGYTIASPTAVVVFGRKIIQNEMHDYLVYRNQMYGNTANIERLINIIIAYYEAQIVGFDIQNFGNGVYDHLRDSTLFPHTYAYNSKVLRGYISNNPVITDTFEINGEKQVRKTNWKNLGTDEINIRLNESLLHLPEKDKISWGRGDKYTQQLENILTVLQSEIQRPMKNRIGGYVYENTVDDHTVDAIRFYYMAMYESEKMKKIEAVKKKMLRMPIFKKKPNLF